jgi:dihydrolipoamide dehydrogenase
VLQEIRFAAGATVAVQTVVAVIGEAGEQPAAPAPAPAVAAPAPAAPAAPAPVAEAAFDYDLVVIGSGPGGYVAAIRAGQLGLKVACVEKDAMLGGTCLHRGCIPTKALLHSASLFDDVRRAPEFGVEVADPRLDMVRVHAQKRKVVEKNAKGIEFLFKKNKVERVHGFGRIAGANRVEVALAEGGSRTLSTRNILIATGSVVREIGVAPSDGERILTSDHLLALERVPASLVVLGAGAVGTEFASIFHSFGAEVTLVEMLPRVLPIEDEEVSKELARLLKKRGIKVHTSTTLAAVERTENGVRCRLVEGEKERTVEAEMLLVAVGRAPVTDGIGLETVGLETARGFLAVDGTMQTAVPGIWAIGDAVNTPLLAHIASAEGIVAVEAMAGLPARPLDYDRTPSCTYCDPEVASVGLTEAEARRRGYDVETGKFAFTALGKAAILGKPEGFVKVVRDRKYDELLGVHILGAHATDLIAEACVALQVEATTEEIVRTIHAHPTLSEAVLEAAHAALGQAIHS